MKYDPAGVPLWARSVAKAPKLSCLISVALDSRGNVYAVGYIGKGTYDFGDGVTAQGLVSENNAQRIGNPILVKYSPEGKAQWVKTLAACTDCATYLSLAVDPAGNLYCGGNIGSGVFDFGDGVTATAGPDSNGSLIVVKYDGEGTAKWARTVPNRGGESWSVSLSAISLDMQGSVYVAGTIGSQAFDFGNGVTLKGQVGSFHVLLAKYDAAGTARGGPGRAVSAPKRFQGVTVDAAGNVCAVGLLGRNSSVDFGNQVTIRGAPGASRYHMLLVKYDSTGTAQWARSVLESVANSTLGSVTFDAAGNVYAAGIIREGTYDLGNGITVAGPRPGRNLGAGFYESSGTPPVGRDPVDSGLGHGVQSSEIRLRGAPRCCLATSARRPPTSAPASRSSARDTGCTTR